jgi:Transposase DDE domain
MRFSVPVLADALQTLFSVQAQRLAHTTQLIRRQRKLTGPDFARALVFGWAEDPNASLDTLTDELPLSPQALHQHLDSNAAEFFAALLRQALTLALSATDPGLELLARFPAVYLEDCTHLSLPPSLADLFPGCGGSMPQTNPAAIKLFIRWDVACGRLAELTPHPARCSDRTARSSAAALPEGSLRLADRGFYDGQTLNADTQAKVWWLTRLPTKLSVRTLDGPYQSLAAFVTRQRTEFVDKEVTAGTKEAVKGRLLAWRCPPAVRRKRLARLRKSCAKLGRSTSAAQRQLCGWTVLLTNLPSEAFSPEEVLALARVRWQVELLIKRFKSQGGVGQSRGHLPGRVLCELYAKLLGQLVLLWGQMLSGGPLAGAGCWRKAIRVRRRLSRLCEALGNRRRLRRELSRLRVRLRRLRITQRRSKPTTRQLLTNPALVT